MRTNLYGTPSAPTVNFSTIAAQSIDAIAVHFPEALLAAGRLLPAGNYTLSTLKGGGGDVPVLRFQSEAGESVAVMVAREYLPSEEVAQRSEVLVVPDGGHGRRIDRVMMEGSAYQFRLPVSDFTN